MLLRPPNLHIKRDKRVQFLGSDMPIEGLWKIMWGQNLSVRSMWSKIGLKTCLCVKKIQ